MRGFRCVPLPSMGTGSCVSASVPHPLTEAPGGALPMRWVCGWGTCGAAPMDHAPAPCSGPWGPQALAGAPGPVPCPAAASPLGHPGTAPARCVAPAPRRELPLPLLCLPALPNNGGPGSLGSSFEFKCSQPLVYKNNKFPSNTVM